MGAALAFYCAFSLVPLLVILVAIAGVLMDESQVSLHVAAQLSALLGPATSGLVMDAVRTSQPAKGLFADGLSLAMLLIGATTVFSALEQALERIWGVSTEISGGIKGWLRAKALALGVILALGFLLLVSLTISTVLSAAIHRFASQRGGLEILAGLDLLTSLLWIATLFSLIFRYIPAHRMPWKVALIGGGLTAGFFELGRQGIGLYLAHATQPSAFGAAASFAALLLWLYYSAQVFLLGAEFTACLGNLRPEVK